MEEWQMIFVLESVLAAAAAGVEHDENWIAQAERCFCHWKTRNVLWIYWHNLKETNKVMLAFTVATRDALRHEPRVRKLDKTARPLI
jgi:hypothetical protein